MGLTEACSRFLCDLVHTFGGSSASASRSSSSAAHMVDVQTHPNNNGWNVQVEDSMVRALITVFGMETSGRIKKDKARRVVEKLGLICGEEEDKSGGGFDLPGDEDVPLEEVLGGMDEDEDGKKKSELLREAFKIFDEDGNGFIEALELKRVLECLGLMDKGWDMDQIEKMLRVVDLNLDGKVDFDEFEFMMGVNSCH
ncbi:hypothetical protein FNV43_RR11650 [Rhamnella rubrinervis]|uniref:EF-hand domain-containing protein n=1 Tax=Rhamnella rubrinervis TaxID=2594499 RepID=A0A8K0H665_9ROSA|nr:hypothetical protein FNV43_RR11650 [Rhamnella rubrinervis]